ncbi:Spo0B domain-containing protein [Gorillibacterium sp. sgz500922]|uniref:Spo0B domain-containing protein n=1 Tax=Gorillibacterium sp. sgz500922 TaxID=3446694 RepID=UPI003F6794FF
MAMGKDKAWQLPAILTGGLGLTVGLPWLPGRAAAALLTAGAVWWHARRSAAEERTRQDDRLLRVLSVYRHDWMNHIQVLMGYIRLNKVERLTDYMDKISGKVFEESYLSRMGVSELAVYYYEFRAEKRHLELEFEIERDIDLSRLPLKGRPAAAFIRDAVEFFSGEAANDCADSGSLSLAFDEENECLLLDFAYSGCLSPDAKAQFAGLLDNHRRHGLQAEQEWREKEAAVAVILPFSGK